MVNTINGKYMEINSYQNQIDNISLTLTSYKEIIFTMYCHILFEIVSYVQNRKM
jgi:hypothetical protein